MPPRRIKVNTQRVQIPAYTDRWMMGDRYGEVVKTHKAKSYLDPFDPRGRTLVSVKLDKSGKVMRFIADDCEYI
jgi:hypothetical protein